MHTGTLPRRITPVEPIKELVQSTDQAWHKGWIGIAAGVVAAGGGR